MVYLVNLLIVIVYYLLIAVVFKRKKIINKVFIIIVTIHATLFRALANPYNYTDTINYATGFDLIKDMSLNEALFELHFASMWGKGYILLNWIIGHFTNNPQFLFSLISIFTVIGVMWFYYKTTNKIIVPVFFYLAYPMLYYMSFGVLRQHFAIVFGLLSIYYIQNEKKSILYSLLSFFMHPSSIILFPYYIWRRFVHIERMNIMTIIYFIVALIIMRLSLNYVLSFFPLFQSYVEKNESSSNIVPIIILGSVLIMCYITGIYKNTSNQRQNAIINFLLYGFLIALFSYGIPEAGRLTLIFIYVFPVCVAELLCIKRKKILINSYLLFVIILTILMIYINVSYEASYNLNYSFFWQQQTI